MKTIELALESTNGYINSFTRNTVEGWWELEVGLPKTWVFDENDEITYEILQQNDVGKLIKVSPKNQDIVIDDLITFVEIIIDTNKKIAEKEKQFTDRMQEMKGVLEKEAKKFYEELDELKVNSFRNLNDNFVKALRPEGEKKPRKPRTKRVNGLPNASGDTKTETETIELAQHGN
jgi:hypothetical protein